MRMLVQRAKSLILVSVVLAMGWTNAAMATEIKGKASKIIDGDSLVVRGVEIRLNGLHAPEYNQRGGEAAKNWMRTQYGGKTLTCVLSGQRSYDRMIATCYGPQGDDIAASLIAAGLARDCPRYSGGRYAQFETQQSRRFPLPGYCK